jgi:hypothetical protein
VSLAAEIALNNQLRAAFERPELDPTSIQGYFREAAASRINLDTITLEFAIRKRLEKEVQEFAEHLDNIDSAHKLRQFVDLVRSLPFPVVLWDAQNVLYGPLRQFLKSNLGASDNGDSSRKALTDELLHLGEELKILSP